MLCSFIKCSFTFIFLLWSFFACAKSTMLCEISSIDNRKLSVDETKYDNDIKYNFQIVDDENIITITIGVIRLEHNSVLFQTSSEIISKKEVVESSHKEYERIRVEELFNTVSLLHTENKILEGMPSKISLWRSVFQENYGLTGFWSAASDEELFVIMLYGVNISNEKDLVSKDLIIAIVDEILSKCKVVSI